MTDDAEPTSGPTSEPTSGPTSDLTPAEQEVRRLLAEARHDEPMPHDVVARLDRVLTGLAHEPARVAPVTQLAARRRRAAGLLVAAAAVVAVGIGLGQVVDLDGSDGADGGAESATAGDAHRETASEKPAQKPAETSANAAEPEPLNAPRGGVAELRANAFSTTVSELQGEYFLREDAAAYDSGVLTRRRAAAVACSAPSWGKGTFVPVRYGGVPGVLVFRRALGDTQIADLYLCGSTEPERSVTLPAP